MMDGGQKSRESSLIHRNSFPLLVGAAGQSNMGGNSTARGGPRDTNNSYVFSYEQFPNSNQTQGWKTAGPGSPNWPWLPPVGSPAMGNNMANHFCDLLQRHTCRPVLLIMHWAGGQPIEEWLPNGGGVTFPNEPDPTGKMISAFYSIYQSALIADIPQLGGITLEEIGKTKLDCLLVHQGEANSDYTNRSTGQQYRDRFTRFINYITDPMTFGSQLDPMIDPEAPVLVGELLKGGTSGGYSTDDRNIDINKLPLMDDRIKTVKSWGLKSNDNLHFDAASLVEFGHRYFNAYINSF